MEEVTGALHAALNRQPLKFPKQVERMMCHRDDDVRIERAGQVESVHRLPLADQQLAVILEAAFCKPCRVQTDNRKPDTVDGHLGHVPQPIGGPGFFLSREIRIAERPVTFFSSQERHEILIAPQECIDMTRLCREWRHPAKHIFWRSRSMSWLPGMQNMRVLGTPAAAHTASKNPAANR
jgi:hypothetical protein